MVKSILDFFKTPNEKHLRRKRLLYHGIILIAIVVFHSLTKYLLDKGSFNIWLFDSVVALVSLGMILTSLYGKDSWVSLYFGLKKNLNND